MRLTDLDAVTAKLHEMAQTRYVLARSPRSEHQARHLREDAEALRAAAMAIEKLRGIKTMGGKALLACVHIVGPDDLIPAPDGMTAIIWANRINATWAKRLKPHPDDPTFRAQACLWPHEDTRAHARGLQPTDEYGWLLKDG